MSAPCSFLDLAVKKRLFLELQYNRGQLVISAAIIELHLDIGVFDHLHGKINRTLLQSFDFFNRQNPAKMKKRFARKIFPRIGIDEGHITRNKTRF